MNIASSLKNRSSNGVIKETDALSIGVKADIMIGEVYELLGKLKKEVGNHYGEIIEEKMYEIKGIKFNAAAFHYDKPIDGQDY